MLPLALLLAIDLGTAVLSLFDVHCNGCHAAAVKMGSLNLESMEGIRTGGNHGTIVVPGKPEESRLYLMLVGKAAPAMPMNGKVMPAAQIEMVRTWIAQGAPAPPAKKKKPQIFSLAWHPDGKQLAIGGFREVRLTDAAGLVVATLDGHAEVVRAVAFSADGKLLVAAGGAAGRKGEVRVWDVARRTALKTIAGHSDSIYGVSISPDGKTIATASYDKLIKLWDVETGKEIRTLKDHIDAVYALEFTPDGKRLVSGAADRTIKVWNPETGERLYTMGEPLDGINSIALAPDGKRVAAGGLDKTVRVWALGEKSGELMAAQIAHEDAITRVAFSRDGKFIVSAAADKTIKVFDSRDLTEIRDFDKQSDWVNGLAYSPDGSRIAVGRFDGTFQIYSSNPDKREAQ